MKGNSLGEFEELVLLAVGTLFNQAYALTVQRELKLRANRSVTISTIHVALLRLQEKGYLESRFDGATRERGGRRKHLYCITKSGHTALSRSREIRNEMWSLIPHASFEVSAVL
jgi:PadR family transcriptional regulator, regulatory protein PadR